MIVVLCVVVFMFDQILTRSPATDIDQESCLSVPLVYGDVERRLVDCLALHM